MNRDKKLQIEIVAVILLTIGRSVGNQIASMIWLGSIPPRPFGYFHFSECLRGLYIIGLVLLVVSVKREPWLELGLSAPQWGKDLVLGVSIMFATALLRIPFVILFMTPGSVHLDAMPTPFQSPSTTAEFLWIFPSAITIGFAEELLTRGYLISRLLRLVGPWKSVILSSLVFSVGHSLNDLLAVTVAFILGLVYGFTFVKTRRLCPLVFGHSLGDIIADFASAM